MSERLNELPDQNGSILHPRIISSLELEKWLILGKRGENGEKGWNELLKCVPPAVKAQIDENEGAEIGHHPVGGWFCLISTPTLGPWLLWSEWEDGTSAHYEEVLEFHRKGDQLINKSPQLPPQEVLKLRAALLWEECCETIKGMGYDVRIHDGRLFVDLADASLVQFQRVFEPNLVEIIDGCADVSVVNTGTLISCGVKDTPLYDLVDKNNLDKFGKGHLIRADGKVIKPKDHTPPDIEGFLRRYQGEE